MILATAAPTHCSLHTRTTRRDARASPRVPLRVEPHAPEMTPTIDLDDDPHGRRREVGNIVANHDLPPKHHAEPRPAQPSPQPHLRRRRRVTHLASTNAK